MVKNWDEYFMAMAVCAADSNSSCLRRQFGAVIVRPDKSIVSTGYNGAPAGVKSCGSKNYCVRNVMEIPSGERQEICYAVHAEQNAIAFAAKHGTKLEGCHIYVTAKPCSVCLRMIVQCGIKKVFYREDYPVDWPGYEDIASAIEMIRLGQLSPLQT